MSDMITNLPQLDFSVANKETQINEIAAMLSPAAKFANNPITTVGLTWGFLGGRAGANAMDVIENGTLSLPASSTNFIEFDGDSVVVNQTGFTSGATALYKVTTGSTTITNYEDRRDAYAASSGGGGGAELPIGAMVAMPLSSPDLVISGATTFLKTGLVSSTATYPLAPKSVYFKKQKVDAFKFTGGAYGNGIYVAITSSATAFTSTDGTTFTQRALPAAPQKIEFGAGLFVIKCNSATCYTSPDGIAWTARSSVAPTNSQWTSLVFGNGIFVARSNTGTGQVLTSPDGINWTASVSMIGYGWTMAYGNSIFVGVENQIGSGIAVSSADGVTWTQRVIPAKNSENSSISWKSVVFGNGKFVAVGFAYVAAIQDNVLVISKSTDGVNWSAVESISVIANGPTIAFVGSTFVICPHSTSGRFYSSDDAVGWKLHASNISVPGGVVCSSNGKGFYGGDVVNSIGTLAISDGNEYTETSIPLVTDSITQTPFYMRVA